LQGLCRTKDEMPHVIAGCRSYHQMVQPPAQVEFIID
jgi:hypothetical protein